MELSLIIGGLIVTIVFWPLIRGFMSGLSGDEAWREDKATDRQLRYLDSLGVRAKKGLTKGEASDLITSREPPDVDDLKVIRFFKRSTQGLSYTSASQLARSLLASREGAEMWANRPPEPIVREFFRFFKSKMPIGIGHENALTLMNSEWSDLSDNQKQDWAYYRDIIEELTAPEARDNYGIKNPSIAAIRKGIHRLREKGFSIQQAHEDIDVLVEILIEGDPRLESN